MAMELIAQRAEAAELDDLDSFVLSLAEQPDASGWQLILMLPLHPDDQDRAQGLDTYAITTHEAVTVYGGIVEWARNGDVFGFVVTDETASTLGLDPQFSVEIAVPGAADVVESALRRILA